MERHAVPQNIMEVEFKLFGALTVRQFGYLAGGLIIALVLYFTKLPALLKFVMIIISVIGGLFLSLVKINGQNSSIWLTNFIVAMFTSQERVWKKTGVVPEVFKEEVIKTREETLRKVKKQGRIKASVTPLTKFETQAVVTEADKTEEALLQNIAQQFNSDTPNPISKQVTQNTVQKQDKPQSGQGQIFVKGYVLDKTEKPVSGALISVNAEKGGFIGEALTDDRGFFKMDKSIEPGMYFASIAAERMNFDYYKLNIKPNQDTIYKFKAK